MRKKSLKNQWFKKIERSFLGKGKTMLGAWGSEQIKKLGSLGQNLVIMKMG